jgi:mannose-6-phosphate isomerase-like protein (cupin superfamily)
VIDPPVDLVQSEEDDQPHASEFRKTMSPPSSPTPGAGPVLVRHEGDAPRERSACGWRDRLISREDASMSPAAWAHAVDIDGARAHYHKRSTELYYVLDGVGCVVLDGVEHPVTRGSLVHIPPGVVHGAVGRMRVLVVGIPDIAEDDYFEPS